MLLCRVHPSVMLQLGMPNHVGPLKQHRAELVFQALMQKSLWYLVQGLDVDFACRWLLPQEYPAPPLPSLDFIS